jgi:hypothetical protein
MLHPLRRIRNHSLQSRFEAVSNMFLVLTRSTGRRSTLVLGHLGEVLVSLFPAGSGVLARGGPSGSLV